MYTSPKPESYELWRKAVVEASDFSLPESWAAGRERVDGIAIDAANTRERDDAIWFMPDGSGGYDVTASIADVGSFVQPGSAVAEHAAFVGQTRYMKSLRRPMLPRRIGEHTLSMSETKVSPALTLHARLDASLNIVDTELFKSAIRPMVATYDEVAAYTNRDDADDPRVDIFKAYESFALKLLKKRQAEGALVLFDVEQGVVTDEEGHVVQLEAGSEYAGKLIVQEFMILTNAALAIYRQRRNIPGLFRRHHLPQKIDIEEAVTLVQQNEVDHARLTQADLGRAFYSREPGVHQALNLPAYDHDSSPLRRFGDLGNHWNMLAHLDERDFPLSAERLEEMAEHLNGVDEEVRKDWQNFREQMARVAERRLRQHSTVLQALPSHEFDPILQAALRKGEAPKGFQTAVEDKLAKNSLRPKDMAQLVFAPFTGEAWQTLKLHLIAHLTEQPAAASTVLELARSRKLVDDITATSSAGSNWHEWEVTIERNGELFVGKKRHAQNEVARHQAGMQALLRLAGVPEEKADSWAETPLARNPKSILLEFAQSRGFGTVTFEVTQEFISDTDMAHKAVLHFAGQRFVGFGLSKKDAEADAAGLAVEALQIEDRNPQAALNELIPNPITLLHQYTQSHQRPQPQFAYRRKGPAGSPKFFCDVVVIDQEGTELTFTGMGGSKATAKKNAAIYANKILLGTPTDELDSRGAVS